MAKMQRLQESQIHLTAYSMAADCMHEELFRNNNVVSKFQYLAVAAGLFGYKFGFLALGRGRRFSRHPAGAR